MKIRFAIAAISAAITLSANAAVIVPVSASAFSSIDANRTLGETIDGSGLTANATTTILDDLHTTANSPSTAPAGDSTNNYWLSASGSPTAGTQVLTFDLGVTVDISAIYLWLYVRSGETDRSLKTFDIYTSTDDITYTEAVTKATLGDFAQPANVEQTATTKTFATLSGIRYVELRNLENHGDTSFYGLSEIRFESAAVPEPSTALLGCLGLLALLRRRR